MKLPSEQSGSSLSRGDPCLGPLCDTLELKGCLSETTRPEDYMRLAQSYLCTFQSKGQDRPPAAWNMSTCLHMGLSLFDLDCMTFM